MGFQPTANQSASLPPSPRNPVRSSRPAMDGCNDMSPHGTAFRFAASSAHQTWTLELP
jgi:hypothetical protein